MTVDRNTHTTAGVGSTGAPAAAAETQRAPFSFLGLSSFGVSRNAPSEILNKAREALLESIKSIPIDGSIDLSLALIDNNKFNRLQLSGIALILKPRDGNVRIAAHHTLVLEGSGPQLDDITEQVQGQQINVPQYTEKVYDSVYANTVSEVAQTNLPNYKLYSVSAEVVPRAFNWDDKEAVRNLAVNAICAVAQELQHRSGFGELDLTETQRDSNLKVLVSYNNGDMTSATGKPVRADLQMTLMAEAIDRGDPSTVNNARRSEIMAKLGGYIDAIWAPSASNQFYAGQNTAQLKQKFVARLTLTRVESMQLMTPGMQLLALASCLQLAENSQWWSYWRPRPAGAVGSTIDKRDVGALNIEANVYDEPGAYGSPLGTKGHDFTDQDLGRFLSLAFAQDLAVAVDVSACDDDTWYNEIFAWAAAGDPGAIQALIDAANHVTHGAFKDFWKGGDVVVQNEDIVLNGYYQGSDGLKHDVRDIDYPAIMNVVGRTNPMMGATFTDTYLRNDQPLAKRLNARRSIIAEFAPGVVWTGTSRRVTVMAPFMQAFLAGVTKCGLNFRMVNPGANGEFHSQRGQADYLRGAAFNSAPSGAFSQGFGTQGSTNMGSRPGYSGRTW